MTVEDEMFHLRPAAPADLPALVGLAAQPFTTGALNAAGLTFSQQEISTYLEWRLPRLLVDPKALLLVFEFRPVNSFKKVPSRVVGCALLQLGFSAKRPADSYPSSQSPSMRFCCCHSNCNHLELSLASLRLKAALSDITVWPDSETAEVHTRFEAAQVAIDQTVKQSATVMVFAFVDPDFQSCGLGSRMLAAVRDKAEQLDKGALPFMAILRNEDASFGNLSGLKEVNGAAGLRFMEAC
ncbi:uncharacterized protein J3D65DRAFT_687707 [Phyllosticta citribraziliensis]|uniref:N-acetyltransferase domain-containing protein n=1 Tax=Phyllosticta citribraziliensis TaxID=989973 RepID=A0ABR1L6X2_9PEZI